MKDWLEEVIEQIAIGECLASSDTKSGTRFGLIAIDNAVEYMLIAYIATYRQLVGGHKQGGISKNDWEKTKRYFEDLLEFCVIQEPNLQQKKAEIIRYHNFRSELYHTGFPVTTSKTMVNKYSALAREILETLYAITFTATEWKDFVDGVCSTICGKGERKSIKSSVKYKKVEDTVKFSSREIPTNKESVALCLHGFLVTYGKSPDLDEIMDMLNFSGISLSRKQLNARLSDLRKADWVRKSDLALTAKGKKELVKKYLLP